MRSRSIFVSAMFVISIIVSNSNVWAVTSLMTEDWESGIDPTKWHAFGYPASYLYTGPEAMGEKSLDANGDSIEVSGVASIQMFPLVEGLKISYRSNLNATGNPLAENHQASQVALATIDGSLVTETNFQAETTNLPHIDQINTTNGMTFYHAGTQSLQTDVEPIQEWFMFSAVLHEDGTFDYYRNDVLMVSSDVGLAAGKMGQDVSLVLYGQSLNTVNLLDDISVEIISEPTILDVGVDIKPGSDPNSVNLRSRGVLPVAILGDDEFDVYDIDLLTLELNGVQARQKGKSGNIGSFEDVNGDSMIDLMLHFEMSNLDIVADATELFMEGLLNDGTAFTGSDSIRIVPIDNSQTGAVVDRHSLSAASGQFGTLSVVNIPEPATLGLLLTGGLTLLRRRR